MTATDVPASVVPPLSIGATYRQLLQVGFDAPEAANLTALTFGLEITPQPWTVREVTHVLFLRHLRRANLDSVNSDHRANGTDGNPVPAPVDPATAPARWGRAPFDPCGGAMTLLTLFGSTAGRTATPGVLRRSVPQLDASGNADWEGG
jgi:hypothetical protein